jgi:NAD(P)-dependent dehydrogenase (short-subunit alcohol dehydrogenase family)
MALLEGKSCLVTGGASGIGLAAARAFAREGGRVMIADRNPAALEAAVAANPDMVPYAVDVADPAAVEAMVKAAVDRFGSLEVGVLNAGVGSAGTPLDGHSIEDFDRVIGINLRGVWLCLRELVRVMKPRGRGSIMLTASIHGHAARTLASPYTTAKHGLVGMAKGAALELAAHGVRVNTVDPGFTDTPLLAGALSAIVPGDAAAGAKVLSRNIPMRRLGRPEEVAEVMLFLASDESAYCTGASFAVDGGVLAAWGPTPD